MLSMESRNTILTLLSVGVDENSTLCFKIFFLFRFNTPGREVIDVSGEDSTSSGTEGQEAR